MATIRASVAQCCTGPDTAATLETMRRLASSAAEGDGSQLIVFPEAFIGGYPKFRTFGASVGTRSDEGRKQFVEYHKAAITVPGPEISAVEQIARDSSIFIVTGFIEKQHGTLYCAAGFFSPTDGFLYRRRKLLPTATERIIWGHGDESDTKVVKAPFATDAGKTEEIVMSSAICWENMMPLLRTHYYKQGTQIHCVPTVDGRPTWESAMRMIAMEGRCFVLSACQQKDYPEGHPYEGEQDPEGIMIAGGSLIMSPMGQLLAGPLRGSQGVLTATLNLDEIIGGKFDLDVVGHYARPDIFKFEVKQ